MDSAIDSLLQVCGTNGTLGHKYKESVGTLKHKYTMWRAAPTKEIGETIDNLIGSLGGILNENISKQDKDKASTSYTKIASSWHAERMLGDKNPLGKGRAVEMLEACRFIYKVYAQTCLFPLDPFFEGADKKDEKARDRLIKTVAGNGGRLTPLEYIHDKVPLPGDSVVFRAGVDQGTHVLFGARDFDMRIKVIAGVPIKRSSSGSVECDSTNVPQAGAPLAGRENNAKGTRTCVLFQGDTGFTQKSKYGLVSWMGAVIHDPVTDETIVVFRGSRSGKVRVLDEKIKDKGNPDWVTDLDNLNGEISDTMGATFSAGFRNAYLGTRAALVEAFKLAVGNRIPRRVYVTGHSLGGALATYCYLDMVAGVTRDMLPNLGDNVWCLPMSAPKTVISRKSVESLAAKAKLDRICHYFSAGDLVHGGRYLDTKLVSKSMQLAKHLNHSLAHPNTEVLHIGNEVPIATGTMFPDAHEPADLFKGLGGSSVKTFWPAFDLDGVLTSPNTAPAGLKNALSSSISQTSTDARKKQWHVVMSPTTDKEKDTRIAAIETLLKNKGLCLTDHWADVSKVILTKGGNATLNWFWTQRQLLIKDKL